MNSRPVLDCGLLSVPRSGKVPCNSHTRLLRGEGHLPQACTHHSTCPWLTLHWLSRIPVYTEICTCAGFRVVTSAVSPQDRQYIRQALVLAKRGLGHTAPNPAVGCVIVQQGRYTDSTAHCSASYCLKLSKAPYTCSIAAAPAQAAAAAAVPT